MIERRHAQEGMRSRALYSPCGTYRYGLERVWQDAPGPLLLWIMLNPARADERRNDPTIARCQRRAQALGFGGMRIANLFAFRAPTPADLRRAEAPVGPENDPLLLRWHGEAAMTLVGWGLHGAHLGRGAEVTARLTGPLHVLGLTKGGHPRHPLYVPYRAQPRLWRREGAA
ncbi:DUF1643 domain-containing protein [Salipiger pacificus]|uniref:DUF1643 domain-containing protein n=2 Tax=Salipiger mangrovisoli TaxID=2865933 RepID=A0ABR9X674_9RHOB|nr:DUF1643 domain-containing protein [Salipiger mangrovisoli]MBE9639029.1 DUF1643 domain-containing protein [Salipiger mangrovisoli]